MMPKGRFSSWLWPIVGYLLAAAVYAAWSFALTDPNMVFTSWPLYWQVQTWLWQNLFGQPIWLTLTYCLSLALLWLAFWGVWKASQTWQWSWKQWFLIWLLAISPLLLSNNALSHDVFNYIFNAKMVLVYHANPHVQVALDFATDPLTRFMHNTHTPAPYGYGWTIFSLLPYVLGLNKFVLTWFLFRCLSVLATGWLIWVLMQLHQQLFNRPIANRDLALVIFNPLFVIELISNSHNDLWLLVPALTAFWLAGQWLSKNKPNWGQLGLSLVLLGFSISTKLVTALLLPLWLTIVAWVSPSSDRLKIKLTAELQKLSHQTGLEPKWEIFWPLLASVILFIPLLTSRAQQFNPWYWTWVLVWLPLIKLPWWKNLLIIFSLSSLLRYIPWLLAGGYNDTIIWQQKLITWSLPLAWLLTTKLIAQYRYRRW
jgi:hypothetical protein